MKEIEYYNSFWYRFTKPIYRWWFRILLNKDKLIKVDARHRGIGKTYMLIDKAVKENIPIIVGNQSEIDYIKRVANSVEVYGFAKNFTVHVLGRKFENGILIDESVDSELIYKLKDEFEIRGGFIEIKDDK